ncbi:spore cortex formation protein SpoVR/YcgB (stage V sporulation) [Lysinibacillus parviboronicapiens]|uniref:Spore cortex formation protein SpoVR/YcgB (Stage V sporulation) n=2 Tax=Lysinibacillus parviboronicapiens TaxID=436516 RepID=A0ABV2PGW4_9BACI
MCHIKKMLVLVLVIFMTASCAGMEKQKIIVQKHNDTGIYEDLKEITKRKKVKAVKDILHSAKWEQMKVDMAREADYQFVFQFVDPNIQTKAILYSVWLSPNKDTLEVVEGDYQYVHLNREDSQKLFEALTETNLVDIK